MIRFLFKGLVRDRSRSLFPVIIVATGVSLTVFFHAYLNGYESSLIQVSAHYSTGHVRVMTKAYAEQAGQIPNDLALLGIDPILSELGKDYPDILWTPRIKFGGLIDIPDQNGETRAQLPVSGLGVDLLSPSTPEWKTLNIERAIVRGRVPQKRGEIVIGDELAKRLEVDIGSRATLISSTMYGSMSITDFTVVGTIAFGVSAMDRGAMIADIADIQNALDMQEGAGEIMGFFPDDIYHKNRAQQIADIFNKNHGEAKDPYGPVMSTLSGEPGMADLLVYLGAFSGILTTIFVFAMSIVLWNAGLMGSLRRYGELGVRLAIGEEKGHLYRSMLVESLLIGFIGSSVGTAVGLAFGYYMQIHGIDIGSFLKSATMMVSDVIRAQVTPVTYVIGFVPGILATLLGTAISGVGIYKRQTSQLFKELE